MGRWRRIALGSALVIATVVAGLALAVHRLVDPERLKALAREKARAAWSRELDIGAVSLSLWPLPAVHAEDITLAGDEGTQRLVQVQRADARLALLPLLTGKARITSIDIEGATLTMPPKDGHALPEVSSRSTQRATSSPQLLDLSDLHVANAEIVTGPAAERVKWHIDEATFSAASGWHDAQIDARLSRNGAPLAVKAHVDDLSHFGEKGNASEGKIELAWAKTHAILAGRIPLDGSLTSSALHVDVDSPSLGDIFSFFQLQRGPGAAFQAHFDLKNSGDGARLEQLTLVLGKAKATGRMAFGPAGPRHTLRGNLAIDRLDWAQALLDAGNPPPPSQGTDLAFNPDPLAWPLLAKLKGWSGQLDTTIGSLKLRNGVELTDAKLHFAFENDRLDVDPLSASLLGGKGTAKLRFDNAGKVVKVNFQGDGLLLERWFKERSRPVPFTGGAMRVRADFTSSGNTMRDLAATATGPITLRMGPGAWHSKRAGETESLMTNAFASEGAEQVQFECVSAVLPFKSGLAKGRQLVGFKTATSELVTSGSIDLRDESLDLHGRVRAQKGVTLGLANIAGDVKIGGTFTKLGMSIDPESTPGIVARAGAAIATLGLSVVGTALLDKAAAEGEDPCRKPALRTKDAGSPGR